MAPVVFFVVTDLASVRLEVIVICPAAPEVSETRLSREPEESVSTLAVTPSPAELMADARPASVWLDEDRSDILNVCEFPFTLIAMEPASGSDVLDTSSK